MEAKLKFKKGEMYAYEATATINGKIYLWGIDNGGFNNRRWCINLHVNGMLVWSDGWEGCTKRGWVEVANREYNEVLNGKEFDY